MIDLLKKSMFLGMGVASVTKEKIEELVDELIKKGEITKNERPQIITDLLAKFEKQEKILHNKIESEVQKAIVKFNIATKNEINKLEKRITVLEKKKK